MEGKDLNQIQFLIKKLDRFSVDQLKAFRRKYPDVKSANKKADLIENISEFIRTHRK